MRRFDELFEMAAARKGGAEAFAATLPAPLPPAELAEIPDHRWLSTLSRHVFSAGFNWKVVEAKWPAFEDAFHGFAPGPCSTMEDEALETAAKAGGIGHMAKARSIRDNALFFRALAHAHGSAARTLADWPDADYVGLLAKLKAEGSRLGGNTAQYGLRSMGKDGFILSKDVTAALIREGVVDKAPSSKAALAAVQAAFTRWSDEAERPMMQVSRVLACTVG